MATRPANKVTLEFPPRRGVRKFVVDMNKVQDEIEEQLQEFVDNESESLEFFEPVISGSYAIKEVRS